MSEMFIIDSDKKGVISNLSIYLENLRMGFETLNYASAIIKIIKRGVRNPHHDSHALSMLESHPCVYHALSHSMYDSELRLALEVCYQGLSVAMLRILRFQVLSPADPQK